MKARHGGPEPRVLAIAAPSFCRDERLRELAVRSFPGWELRFCNTRSELTGSELTAFLRDAEFAVIGKERIDDELLAAVPSLAAIGKYGVGLERIDLAACSRHGVKLFQTPGVNALAVAEMTLGLMLALRRRIVRSDRLLRAGLWQKDGGHQVIGSRVAIIGCGAVGSALARLLSALQCRLLLCDIVAKHELAAAVGGELCSFREAIMHADLVSLHVPLTSDTRHMINAASLKLFPATSGLINTSRGEVVDSQALAHALQTGALAGAALDVFEGEPAVEPELLACESLVATPHSAGNSNEAVWAMGKGAISGLLEYTLLKT